MTVVGSFFSVESLFVAPIVRDNDGLVALTVPVVNALLTADVFLIVLVVNGFEVAGGFVVAVFALSFAVFFSNIGAVDFEVFAVVGLDAVGLEVGNLAVVLVVADLSPVTTGFKSSTIFPASGTADIRCRSGVIVSSSLVVAVSINSTTGKTDTFPVVSVVISSLIRSFNVSSGSLGFSSENMD